MQLKTIKNLVNRVNGALKIDLREICLSLVSLCVIVGGSFILIILRLDNDPRIIKKFNYCNKPVENITMTLLPQNELKLKHKHPPSNPF